MPKIEQRVASRYLKKAGNEYRLSVHCLNHKREVKSLQAQLARMIKNFNAEFQQDSTGLDLNDPGLKRVKLLMSPASSPVVALATYMELLDGAEADLLKAAGLD